MNHPKKLIEVALPLETINREAAREKSIRHGHPSTLHLWWARRPLAACRAVIFAQMVDDPGSHPELFPTEEAQKVERERLFDIIREMVRWENINNEPLLEQARAEIHRYAPNGQPPPLLDPFAGGGSIPLEAQRLGLEAHASDLNPVAVLINKALIEIPPKFAGRPPVYPSQEKRLIAQEWKGAQGLAEDVRYYGKWMRDEAEKRIGELYPKADGKMVIAWLWARTVTCPNPACQAKMPLVRSFALSTKKGKEAWIEPVIDRTQKTPRVRFEVRTAAGKLRDGTVNRKGAMCICCNTPVPFDHVRAEGKAGRMGAQLMAMITENPKGFLCLSPTASHEVAADVVAPQTIPDATMAYNPFSVRPPLYGFETFAGLFTARQLTALGCFSDLIIDAQKRAEADALAAGMSSDGVGISAGGDGAYAYAEALATYLAFAVDRSANYWSSLTPWGKGFIVQTFGRQALPMIWDYAEGNPFSDSTGNWTGAVSWIANCLETSVPVLRARKAIAFQHDAMTAYMDTEAQIVCTDPPYYNNVDYADISDYFYVWLRRNLLSVFPELLSTLLTPKREELVATPYRFSDDKDQAREFFETGLNRAFVQLRRVHHPDFPLTVFYAFRQAESEDDDEDDTTSQIVSTGWETMLEGLIRAGFVITGTWPLRTERDQGLKSRMNVLASSVLLVCRPKIEQAPLATRREFLAALKRELPAALKHLQQGNIAPVDLAQASIGPGMAIYSRYGRVLESEGSPMRVRAALALINQALDEYLAEQEGEYDADTRWALAWFEQHTFEEGAFGDADTLSRAKNTSVEGMVQAGILHARAGKVRLLRRDELDADWDPASDRRVTVWEVAQHLIRTMDKRGEQAAAALLAQVGGLGEVARDLAYRLYTLCERKGWATEALPYNGLVVAWPELVKLAQEARRVRLVQEELEWL